MQPKLIFRLVDFAHLLYYVDFRGARGPRCLGGPMSQTRLCLAIEIPPPCSQSVLSDGLQQLQLQETAQWRPPRVSAEIVDTEECHVAQYLHHHADGRSAE